ncbi:MAG: hypothetical protein E7K72_25845 [Roseomonas mucosa]|nr:hypothetical protein [Roseomonas mucosa]
MLPTAADREKAIQAYVAMEHRKKTDKRYVTARGRTQAQPVRNYPGFEHGSDTRNPWHGVLEHQIGGDALAEAKRRHRTEVMDRAEAATGTAEALRHADPLLYGDYGMSRTLNAPVARLLWDKAQEEGILDQPLRDALPGAVDLTGMSYPPRDLTVRGFLLSKLPPDEAAALREGSAA